MSQSEYLKVAKLAAQLAGQAILELPRGNGEYLQKTGHTDIVTKADELSDRKIRQALEYYFPNHSILSEESGLITKDPRYHWIVDPLDGTISFLDNLPYYSVSIGLNIADQPQVGVVNAFGTDDLYAGEIGRGAFLNDQPICVSQKTDLSECVIGLEMGYHNRSEDLDRHYRPLVDRVRYAYTFGGAAYGQALVAQGRLDAYVHTALIWDFAGGVPIVLAAGGMATAEDGGSIDWSKEKLTVVTSNGGVHNQIIEALNG